MSTHENLKRTLDHAVNAKETVMSRAEYTLKAIEDRFIIIDRADLPWIEDPEAARRRVRDGRREEAIRELFHEAAKANNLPAWDDLSPMWQRAIDRIIELEGEDRS